MRNIIFASATTPVSNLSIYSAMLIILIGIVIFIRRILAWYLSKGTDPEWKKQTEITPEEFFRIRKRSMKSNKNASTRQSFAFTGVYILHNKTQDRYYVGQGRNVLDRVNQHLSGRGNGEIYADYRNGDTWTIQLINFSDTYFNSLNELERHMIRTHDAYFNGYNKTRGNR